MKYALIAILALFNALTTSAQKNNLYADAGLAFSNGGSPGFSITYDYKLTKHLGLGLGFQGYSYYSTLNNAQFTPAAFADLRVNFKERKKGFYFLFFDLGISFYKSGYEYNSYHTVVDSVSGTSGTYAGLGYGYFRRITKQGGGLYATLKFISNTYRYDEYHLITQKHVSGGDLQGTLALSIGFKF